jgi:hypothetical protein
MTQPPISPGPLTPPPPPPPPRQDWRKRGPSSDGCASFLLFLFGLVLLLPGACVIAYVKDHPGQLFTQGADVLWTFLMVSAGGLVLIVLAMRR